MSKPLKCISVIEAKQLYSNWVNTRADALEKVIGAVDARDFVFSVAELDEFLAYVKSESAKQDIKNPGIRIHFAAYDNDTSNKATVFLAPTNGTSANDPVNYDIDPLNRGNTGWPPNNY